MPVAWLTLWALIAAVAPISDPVDDAYKLQFENEWVRIVRVVYPAHTTLPAHDHPQRATAYVYLNDAGPVIFRHVPGQPVTRPATKAGGFRLFRAVPGERHAVENGGDVASEFLRVELKTEPREQGTLRGRYPPEDVAAGENVERVQFENEQVRITRLICASGKTLHVSTTATEPSVLVAINGMPIQVQAVSGESQAITLTPGQERWLDTNQREQIENRGSDTLVMLRFDFKTPPIR
jgi:hypothetical protein